MPITEPHQREFRGLVMGPGTPYPWTVEEGLETLSVRSGTRAAPRAAGSIPGLHVADSKRIVVRGWVDAHSVSEMETLWATLRAAFTVSESEQHQYRFRHEDGIDRFVWARVLDRPSQRDQDSEATGVPEWSVGFEVADPRIYSVELFSAIVPLFSAGGGELDFPGEFPEDWGEIVLTNATLTNTGDQDAYPLFRFQFPAGGTGDCDGVTVTNTTNGDLLEIAATDILQAGQTLVADMDAYARAVADNLIVSIGSSSRFGAWSHPRDPLKLSPGENILTFEVDGTTEDIICRADWRSTSI